MITEILLKYKDNARSLSFKRGESIYRMGESPEGLFLVQDGLVGLYHTSENGSEFFLRVFAKGFVFGHRALMARGVYHANSTALQVSNILFFSKTELEKICEKEHSLLRYFAEIMAKELRNSELRLAGQVDKNAQIRIIESILFLKLRNPDYSWTRQEIANFSGSTQESVSRLLGLLEKESLIIKKGRNFEISSIEKLMDYSKSLS